MNYLLYAFPFVYSSAFMYRKMQMHACTQSHIQTPAHFNWHTHAHMHTHACTYVYRNTHTQGLAPMDEHAKDTHTSMCILANTAAITLHLMNVTQNLFIHWRRQTRYCFTLSICMLSLCTAQHHYCCTLVLSCVVCV